MVPDDTGITIRLSLTHERQIGLSIGNPGKVIDKPICRSWVRINVPVVPPRYSATPRSGTKRGVGRSRDALPRSGHPRVRRGECGSRSAREFARLPRNRTRRRPGARISNPTPGRHIATGFRRRSRSSAPDKDRESTGHGPGWPRPGHQGAEEEQAPAGPIAIARHRQQPVVVFVATAFQILAEVEVRA